MTSHSATLAAGVAAFKQGNYDDAIALLEQTIAATPPPECEQVQGWLVRAYLKVGNTAAAHALCQTLARSDRPAIQAWAQATLAQFPAEVTTPQQADPAPHNPAQASSPRPRSPTEAEALFSAGMAALRKRHYADAIQHLETFLAGTDEGYANYAWARTSLAKAYKGNGQTEAAIALARELANSDRESTRAWATDFLKTLASPPPDSAPTMPQDTDHPEHAEHSQAPAPFPTTYRSLTSSPRDRRPTATPAPTRPASKDLTPLILSGLAHGSISLFASLLLFILFPNSVLATVLGLLRLLVPIAIFLTTRDLLVKENAREATNYSITCILLIGAIALFGWIVVFALATILIAMWPLFLLLALPLVAYLLALAAWPVAATILCLRNGGQVARYPNWLVWHAV